MTIQNKKKKPNQWYLLTNSSGSKSVTYTMVVIGFGVITLWLGLSIFHEVLGVQTREFDATQAMAYFSPILLSYVGRKHTDATTGNKSNSNEEQEE